MRILTILFTAAISLLALASCANYEPEPEFLEGTTICLKVDGETVHTYDSANWQYSYTEKTYKYKVFSDDMSNYYIITCDKKPSAAGQEITATLRWAKDGAKESVQKGLKFEVQRTDEQNGIVWLWCSKKNIGATIIE